MMLAAVLTIPIGVLTSCATPATICASARYFSSSISVLATRCASSCRNRSSVVVRRPGQGLRARSKAASARCGMAARKSVRRSTNNWQAATASAVASRAPPSSRASSPNDRRDPHVGAQFRCHPPALDTVGPCRRERSTACRLARPAERRSRPLRRTRRARPLRPCEAVRQRCWQMAVSWKRRCERACQPQPGAGSTHLYWLEHSPASRPLRFVS